MERQIKVQRMVTTDVVVGMEKTCDRCGKLILKKNEDKTIYCIGKHWKLTTGHDDWGNDSCDSIVYKDICSIECLEKELHEYASCFGTAYFEVYCQDCRKVDE